MAVVLGCIPCPDHVPQWACIRANCKTVRSNRSSDPSSARALPAAATATARALPAPRSATTAWPVAAAPVSIGCARGPAATGTARAAPARAPELRRRLTGAPMAMRFVLLLLMLLACALVALDLFIGPRPVEQLLELVQGVGADRPALPARHHEPHLAIEHRQLVLRQRARELLRKPEPRDARAATVALLDVVVDLDLAVPHEDVARQRQIPRTDIGRDERVELETERRRAQVVEGIHIGERRLVHRRQVGEAQSRCLTSRSAIHLPKLLDCRAVALHRRMSRLE